MNLSDEPNKEKRAIGQPKKYDEPTKHVSFSLPVSVIENLKILAGLRKTNQTQLILSLINAELEKEAENIDAYKKLLVCGELRSASEAGAFIRTAEEDIQDLYSEDVVCEHKNIPQRLSDIEAAINEIIKCIINIQNTHMLIANKQNEVMGKMLNFMEGQEFSSAVQKNNK